MLYIALIINIVVLVPVCLSLHRGSLDMTDAFGPKTPARGILLAMYLSILLISTLMLADAATGTNLGLFAMAPALLLMQVMYKSISAVTVGRKNPVVKANLVIAATHTVALVTLLY